VVDETGATHKVQAIELKSVSKISSPKKGNPLEITTQGDGSSVGIKEAAEEGYVKAKISVPIQTYPKDTVVQVKALDYTSKADGDQIDILLPNNKLVSIKKNDVKLFEAGVYNSETDIKNNPKTKENKPDESTGKMDFVLSGIENQIVELSELKKMIDEETSFSSETIETCIAELTMYKTSLSTEREKSAGATVEN